MAGLGPHQENPHQADPQQTEPIGSQRQNNPPNPGTNPSNGRNHEGSVHTTQMSQSHTQIGSRVSRRRNSHQAMQREIDDLKRKLRRTQQKRSPSSSDTSSNEEEDVSYRRRLRTPPSETFSYKEELRPERRYESPSSKGLGNDAMNKALNQISKSPFVHRIKGAKLLWRFNQPTFAIYNGRADPVEHVRQFNQKMAIYSQNEAIMCKVFPSSLRPVAMRWFNSLKTNSIGSYKQLTQAFCSCFITNSRVP